MRASPGLLMALAALLKTRAAAGMYEPQEEVVRRRRARGDTPWNWNIGLVAPIASPKEP